MTELTFTFLASIGIFVSGFVMRGRFDQAGHRRGPKVRPTICTEFHPDFPTQRCARDFNHDGPHATIDRENGSAVTWE